MTVEPDQVKQPLPIREIVERRHRSVLARFCQVANGPDETVRSMIEIRLKVAAADDAFLGVEVD